MMDMNMDVEEKILKKCVKGPVTVCFQSQLTAGTSDFSGKITLKNQIANILSMQVKCINITAQTGTVTSTQSNLWCLRSNKLGSQLMKNPFHLGAIINSPTNQVVEEVSNIIAITPKTVIDNINTTPLDTLLPGINGELKFCKPVIIDSFDWQIAPLIGTITSSAISNVEIVLTFFPACDCNPY
jgi:hypothetical protein